MADLNYLSSGRPAEPLLSVSGVTVKFRGIVALDQVSFDIQRGQIAGLIGPNGAGKTTLFNCLSRIYPYSEGRIVFDGHPLEHMPRHKTAEIGIGRTFQNLALYRTMSVRDNIRVGCHCRAGKGFLAHALQLPGVAAEEREISERAAALVDFLDLGALADRRVSDLPFGSQKRVELGRALASQPKLLLLDEPAAGLNHEELDELGQLIRKVRDDFNTTVLLVEHHMSLVMSVSDKVVALNFGRKIADDIPQQVRKHPDVIQAYLGVDDQEATPPASQPGAHSMTTVH
jgi:branched-chain amino acid transport system ATP-binding protein